MKASAFSPGHITGFFEVFDTGDDPLAKGSRGAGFSLERGVRTDVVVEKSDVDSISIYFDGVLSKTAIVSEKTIDIFFRKTGIRGTYCVEARHAISVPFGSGFGSSGAGSLSLAIALNEAFGAGLSENEVAGMAHVAEVESKTGLGSVVAEAVGGVEIRLTPGGPGISRVLRVPVEGEYKILTLTIGPLSTKKYLEEESVRKSINRFGGALVDRLAKEPTVPLFLDLSREFAENTGLLPPDIVDMLAVLDRYDIQASMPMFGHGLFTILPVERMEEARAVFAEFDPDAMLIVSDICRKGAHAIHES